ncbi:hypothetical protein LPJ66_003819 [Kickxella alabastrina]|uniref:Uncharacterized protein n=1 Tax=Kickxella alabastrina TaxID=61397 RepID=A0ACC1IMH3_9FUNG|nr:hypothetical protein LPJ66_003819 [Kickxella alabastrina]
MSENSLDNEEFDVVVLGTGLIESIIASDIAAADRKVLHIDRNPYYGGNFACFSLSSFFQWAVQHRDVRQTPRVEVILGDASQQSSSTLVIDRALSSIDVPCTSASFLLQALEPYSTGGQYFDSERCKALLERLVANDRKYSIELAPKLSLCRGDMIDLLVDMGIGEYVQFKGLEHNYLVRNGVLERVPDSKEDIFASKSLSLIEKRKLMRLMTVISDDDDCDKLLDEATQDSSDFVSFIQTKFKLDGKLLDAVVYAVARVSAGEIPSARDGCESVRKYVRSMGRYGRMAYLCAMYGGGSEMAQAFCRLCAVSGGTYILGEDVEVSGGKDGGFNVRLQNHGTVRAKSVIMASSYANASAATNDSLVISRAFCILDQPVLGDDTSALLSYIGKDGEQTVSLLYLTQATMATPLGHSILYAWAPGQMADRKEQLNKAMQAVIHGSASGATPLLTAFFEMRELAVGRESPIVTGLPDATVDFDSTVKDARRILSGYFSGQQN